MNKIVLLSSIALSSFCMIGTASEPSRFSQNSDYLSENSGGGYGQGHARGPRDGRGNGPQDGRGRGNGRGRGSAEGPRDERGNGPQDGRGGHCEGRNS